MPAIQFPTANAAYSGGGLTNPDNGHADDGNYATCAPAKNSSTGSTYSTFGLDSLIPSDATVQQVRLIYEYKVSVNTSIATARVRARVGGVDEEAHDNTVEPLTDTVVSVDVTADRAWTRNDLLDANFAAVFEGVRGNSSTAVTFSLDYLKVEVTYTRALALASGSFTVTGQATGLKATRRLALATGAYTLAGQAVGLEASGGLFDGLTAAWRLEETSGTRIDATGRGHDLTDNNTVTQAAGKVGNAAQFTRANSESLSTADHADLSGAGDFTLAAWVRLDSKSNTMFIIAKADDSLFVYEYEFQYHQPSDRFSFVVGDTADPQNIGFVNADTPSPVAIDTWYLIICWHDSVNDQLGIQVSTEGAEGTVYTTGYADGVKDTAQGLRLGADNQPNWFFDGRIDAPHFWPRVLTASQRSLLWNDGAGLEFSSVGSTLALSPSAYTLTGQATGLRAARKLTAASGGHTLTGQAIELRKGYHLAMDAGSYAVSGQAVGLKAARTLTTQTGVYSATGNVTGLQVDRHLAAAAGTYSLTGNTVELQPSATTYTLATGTGVFTLMGQPAGLPLTRRLPTETGAYIVAGQSLGVEAGRRLSLGSGDYFLTGQSINLKAERRLTVINGIYGLTGNPAGVHHGRTLSAAPAVFALTGQAINLLAGQVIAAEFGGFGLTGNDVSFSLGTAAPVLTAGPGVFAFAGHPLTVQLRGMRSLPAEVKHVGADSGVTAISPSSATLRIGSDPAEYKIRVR